MVNPVGLIVFSGEPVVSNRSLCFESLCWPPTEVVKKRPPTVTNVQRFLFRIFGSFCDHSDHQFAMCPGKQCSRTGGCEDNQGDEDVNALGRSKKHPIDIC